MRAQLSACAFLLCAMKFVGTGAAPRKSKKLVYPKDENVTAIRDLIQGLGFIYESYDVTTEDGYIINLNRMASPKLVDKRDRGVPLLLVNGLFMHSEAWMLQSVEDNIAGNWAKRGYDVWLGDQRGSLRSMRHVNYTIKQTEYWDFSFHESGIYDLPAFVDFIIRRTGHKKIIYSCMSLGCSFHFVLLAERPEYNEKFFGGIDFVPVGIVPKMMNIPMAPQLSILFLDLLLKSYKKQGVPSVRDVDLLKKQLRSLCGYNTAIFSFMLQMFFGPGQQFDQSNLCAQLALAMGGSSLKTLEHVVQLFESGEFAQYNYGREGNLKHYGKELPPLYDFGKITSFVAIYGSEYDVFAPPKMVDQMMKQFGGPTYHCEMAKFNHLDVAIGTSFNHIFPDVCELMDSLCGYSNDTRKSISGTCPTVVRKFG